MKKLHILILLIFVTTLVFGSNLEKNQYRVFGKIEGLGDATGTIIIRRNAAEGGVQRIPIQFKDGEFDYVGTAEEAKVVPIIINDPRVGKTHGTMRLPVKCGNIWFVTTPSKEIEVKGNIKDFVDAYPTDGGENDILNMYLKEVFPVINKIGNSVLSSMKNKNLNAEEKQAIESELVELAEKQKTINMNFLKNNQSSVAGLWLLEELLIGSKISIEEAEAFLKNVESKYSTLSYYKSISARIASNGITGIGKIVPDIITNNTPDGKEFDIKSLRGKYVVIDVWGTWCGPCVAGIPHLKAFRDKHQDKLKLLSISNDNDVEKWKKMIVKKHMNWPNILVGKGKENYVDIFNIKAYPTLILIDPDGEILLRSVGGGDNFHKEVEKIIE